MFPEWSKNRGGMFPEWSKIGFANVPRMVVENSPESHNPVENQRFTRSGRFEKWGSLEVQTRGPNRPGEAGDGPLRAGKG